MCLNCLREGHSSRYCSLRLRCKECNRRHNTVLHRDNPAPTDERKPAEPAATAICAYSKKSIAFPIVAVTVTAAGKKIDTLAVLDQCSDVTLCTSQLLNKLQVKGKRAQFSVDTVNGRHTDYNSRTTNLKIKSADGTASFDLTGVKSVPQLPVTVSSMAGTEALKHFEHLSDIKLPDASYSSIDILIGSNVPDCFVVREQRIGASGEPYAQ